MKFTLPKPPAVNHIYALSCRSGYAKSYIAPQGVKWFQDASLVIYSINKHRRALQGPLEVYLDLFTCRFQDIDGIIKPSLDLLTKTKVIDDDSQIIRLEVDKIKVKHKEEEKIIIEIVQLGL